MSPRPLRQFYGHDRRFVIDGLGPPSEPFRRLRSRFLEALEGLSDDEWTAKTRCDAWDAKDIVNHLVSVDGFWALTINGRGQPEPTSYLTGFHPATSPDGFIAAKRELAPREALDALVASTEQLGAVFDAVPDDEWTLVSESPLGHLPVNIIAAHGFWDSWVHERDVLLPLGRTIPVEDDELLTATVFSMFIGAAQGGVLDDDAAVGDGPDAPVDATVAFDDLPGRALRVRVDRDVVVEAAGANGQAAAPGGSAVEFVDAFCGRVPAEPVLERLPADAAAQFARARQIL